MRGTIIEVAEAVRAGELSAVKMAEECLERLEKGDADLNAFVHVDPGQALAVAASVDREVAAGRDPGPLAGVPFGVKDLEDCAGMPTSKGSLLFKDGPPAGSDSLHVGRLRAAGGVPVGKTAAPEFGTVCFTSTRAWGTTRNPWDPTKTPGGSSGGSAAAVAAGMVPFCTASDGGGSIRIPAAFSGLVGHKPSFGRIPHSRTQPSETSVAGALTTTVADAARHMDIAAGPDDRDKASLPAPDVRYETVIESLEVSGLRALWSPDLGFAPVEPEVSALAGEAADSLVAEARLRRVSRPVSLTDPVRVWLTAGAADLWTQIDEQTFDERSGELDVSRLAFESTRGLTLAKFGRVVARRDELEAQVAELFSDVDVLLTPTTAVPAFPAEGRMPREIAGVEVHPAMAVPFTMLANLCWNPATSVPAGTTGDGLPVGLQIMVRRHRDDVALRLARILELVRPWPRLAPGWSL